LIKNCSISYSSKYILIRKSLILSFLLLLFETTSIYSQGKQSFSGEVSKFKDELTIFMGPNLNESQALILNNFLARWDSSGFSKDKMVRIINISSQIADRNMRPVPHFINYLKTLTEFCDLKPEESFFNNWLTGLSETAFDPNISIESINKYLLIAGSMVRENVLFESLSVKWKFKNKNIEFRHDTVFKIVASDVTLICYSMRDSTEIYNVSGVYYPDRLVFEGTKGTVTWEKAGYSRENVYAELFNYKIDISKSSFVCDTARLIHKTYFKEPVYGVLSDQVSKISSPEKASYPRFETFTKKFQIENIYKGINYEGGLSLNGAIVNGTGQDYLPAKITLYRNDTLYLKINSKNFLLAKNGINSQDASASLYLEKDSIYHSNLGFAYNVETREVNLFRTNSPVSKSPFFDSFHKLDMYFENLSWDMDESLVIMSRSRGAAIGLAQFESISFYSDNSFQRIMGIDDYHPLYRLKQFAAYFYSETFPVKELALWMKRPEEAVTGLCIDLANKGFIFYDRTLNEVTIKKKVDDYINSSSRKQDYDVLTIASETGGDVDNATLDLHNFRLTINGVSQVLLSDSQKVAVYPYKQQVVVGKNRDIAFDGVVEAGLFTMFGHNFSFSYDTFKIRLQKIDSIRISVETNENDAYGNPIIQEIDNIIELGTADLFIDSPKNKSGLMSLKQYPIINAITDSYIFYDKIPGLEGIYKQDNFYFKIDPFTYENLDHYSYAELNLAGEFHAGNILSPLRQLLIIQDDNSLGFAMDIPNEGLGVYGNKGRIYDYMSMSNKGLISSGTLKRLTSTTLAEEFKFFPDSMITQAMNFDILKNQAGSFPDLKSQDVKIKWLPEPDEWYAYNAPGKNFNMFNNGTVLDGGIILSPSHLAGSGTINMTDSRINSNSFRFSSNSIQSDTSDYNLKSQTGDGYTFIAENANTNINFDLKQAKFSLNTDSSFVKFPEIEYICTMTNFLYDMNSRVLNMEQRGIASTTLMPAGDLLKINLGNLDKPTFFSTNNLKDTISFRSLTGNYHMESEFIEANNINYINIADALIQPENGKIVITKRAKIEPLQDALVAINNRHIIHTSNIEIEDSKRYSGRGIYDYLNENNDIQQINFTEIKVDTATSSAKGYIAGSQNFKLNPAFSYTGDVSLYARADFLSFTGAAGIVHDCNEIKSFPVKFTGRIDPKHVMIPLSDKSRDINDNLVFSGSFITIDSTHIYPAFLSERKSWSDSPLVSAYGYLYYEKETNRYKITSLEKLADQSLNGEMVTFDKNFCILTSEGKLSFGANFDFFKLSSSGKVLHNSDSSKITILSLLGLEFYFSAEALNVMSNEIKMMPSLSAVNLTKEIYNKGMKDLLGTTAAARIKEEIDLFGTIRNLPKEFTYHILLNDVNLYWNQATASFRSKGKIGLGFIGQQPLNVYVDGYIEIQRRRSGDMIDIYLKADNSTWYYFSYFRGVLMTLSGNNNYNTIIKTVKLNDRKHPDSSVKIPYTYMIAVEDRLSNFLKRMAVDAEPETP
jgi:hypothetical protein